MNTLLPQEPRIERETLRVTEHTLTLPDGACIHYRAWLPPAGHDRAVVLFHRGHEHSGRWEEVVQRLSLPATACFAWDARGHGCSTGGRGSAPNFATFVADADCFVRHLCREHALEMENVVLMAHSVGAVIAVTWVHDYAPPIRGMVLATPAFDVKLYVPLALPALRLLQRVRRGTCVKSYVGGRWLTHDPAQARAYDHDPAICRNIPVNILLDLFDTSRRIVADAGAITAPTLLLAAGRDRVVQLTPQRAFFERLGARVKAMHVLDGCYHAVFHETQRHKAVGLARTFIEHVFAQPPERPSLLEADQAGFTRDEYHRLHAPLEASPLRQFTFAAQRLSLRTLGRLSRGIRIGWRAGFDSGESLDYVYQNRPQGVTPLGRWIDRVYLDSIGWRGIRRRKAHLQETLRDTIRSVLAERPSARVLDIAAGGGRYLLETLKEFSGLPVSATLRDRSISALAEARRLAGELGLDNVAFEAGDAFDGASLAAIQPAADIAIVSGLYELFPRNALVLESLRGLSAAVRPGGYLIYTGQPWHPQVEMIARVLTNRDGEPWVMRRRTQAELDELVRAAGFEKLGMKIDPWGIFTVSVARNTLSMSPCGPA